MIIGCDPRVGEKGLSFFAELPESHLFMAAIKREVKNPIKAL